MTTSGDPPDPTQAVRDVLAALRAELGEAVRVDETEAALWTTFDVTATQTRGCCAWVLVSKYEVIAGVAEGGRWELGVTADDVDFVDQLLRGVTGEGVFEVSTVARSRVTVKLPSGRRVKCSVAKAPAGCLPLPGWRWWGRKTRYEPYVSEHSAAS